MKRIVSNNNYVQLEEFNIYTNRYVLQLGFALSGLTYKIENRNVKFYLKEDYFYKNSVWSADIPLEIDGKTYTQENIADGLAALFGQTGGGVAGVVSVNDKTGIVKLTAEDVDAYTKEEVDDLINQINSEIDALEHTVNGHTQDIDTINSEIVAINGNVEVLEGKVTALETDNVANKTDIQNLKDSVSALRERVTALETAAANNLVASNIKSGTNISVSVSGNDVTISTVGIPTVEGLAELEEQVSANTTAIEGIQQEITGKEHFRGYFATNAEIQELTATNGDFAFSAESGTKWAYNNNVWTDTEKAVPDKTVEKSTTVPLMDGTATIGSSNKYAAADHIHPTDTTRASQSDLTALETQVQANTTAIGNKANQSDLNALSNGLSEKANSADLATVATSGSYNDLTNKPVIPDTTNLATKSEVDAVKAYYIDFAVLTTQGITDAVWDGIVAAINAHRPIYAGLGNRYYTAECLYQDGSNIIRMTASDELNHFFYLFTKRGTNDYSFTYETRPYTTQAEKDAWSAKQDALVSGTNIKTINGKSLLGEGNIEIQGGAGGQQQADWNQTETTAVDYIKNKPTNVSAFTNDAGYLTRHQSLADYYTKTESDNKFALKFTDVDNIKMVSALPSNPDSRTLYLIPVE